MPMVQDEPQAAPAPRVAVHGSIAIELEWVLAAAGREQWKLDHPTLEAVYGAHPDLVQRVAGIWTDPQSESCCFMEMAVLGYRGGHLFTLDADAFIDDLERMCSLPAPDADEFPLQSEHGDDREAILRRLELLREDAELRQRYVTLMRDLWDVLRPDFDRFGRSIVESSISSKTDFLAKGGDWRDVVGHTCDFNGVRDQIAAAMGEDGEIVIVPAFFTHVSLIFDLPGTFIIGIRPDATAADARARTEVLARRLKAISDPTRLAIVDTLRRGPRSVTELAEIFGVAQPTVSNHVKLLREAGLVIDTRDGTRRKLTVQTEVADELLANLTHVLLAPKPKELVSAG